MPDSAQKPPSGITSIILGSVNFLMLPGLRWRWSRRVHLEQMPASEDELTDWFSAYHSGVPIDIVLGERLVLTKVHKLPRKARGQAQKILKLRAEALAGGSKSKLLSVSQLEKRGRTEDQYAQYLAQSADVNRLTQVLEKLGIPLRTISFQATHALVQLTDYRKRTDRTVRGWWSAFVVGAIGLCGLAVTMQQQDIWQLESALSVMRGELSEVQSQAESIVSTAVAADSDIANLNNTLDQLQRGQSTVSTIAQLSAALDDDVWISELALDLNGELRISGVSQGDVIDVIEKLGAQSWVRLVTLTRPVRTDSVTKQSNFDLLIEIDHETGK